MIKIWHASWCFWWRLTRARDMENDEDDDYSGTTTTTTTLHTQDATLLTHILTSAQQTRNWSSHSFVFLHTAIHRRAFRFQRMPFQPPLRSLCNILGTYVWSSTKSQRRSFVAQNLAFTRTSSATSLRIRVLFEPTVLACETLGCWNPTCCRVVVTPFAVVEMCWGAVVAFEVVSIRKCFIGERDRVRGRERKRISVERSKQYKSARNSPQHSENVHSW